MNTIDSRQKIISSLLKHLPSISKSLNHLLNYLNSVINSENTEKGETFEPIYKELRMLLSGLTSVITEVPPRINRNEKVDDILSQYEKGIKSIILGLENILKWIEDEKKSEEKLEKSVDFLFKGGQHLLKLVETLTKDESR